MAKRARKARGGKRRGAGRPKGRQNDRTILLRQGLDETFPDAYCLGKLKKYVEAGGQLGLQALIQLMKWKGYTERHEVVRDTFPADGVFRAILSTGDAALGPPEGGDGSPTG